MNKKRFRKEIPVVGFQYGKSDMARCGLFSEMSYMEGKGYVSPHIKYFNEDSTIGLQMLSGVPKIKCGTQDGYFEPVFNRIFIKEAYTDVTKLDNLHKLEEASKNINPFAIYPPSPGKVHSTPGDYYGTFIKKMPALSPRARDLPKKGPWFPSIISSPPKFFGCGYVDITISRFPRYVSSPYSLPEQLQKKMRKKHKEGMIGMEFIPAGSSGKYFGPDPYKTKRPIPTYKRPKKEDSNLIIDGPLLSPGIPKDMRCHYIGFFNPYPEHKSDPYLTKDQVAKYINPRQKKMMDKINAHHMAHTTPFSPPNHLRSTRTKSIIYYNIDYKVNAKNWRTYKIKK